MFPSHIPIILYALLVLFSACAMLFFAGILSSDPTGDLARFLPDEVAVREENSRGPCNMRSYLVMSLTVPLSVGGFLLCLWLRAFRLWLGGDFALAFFPVVVFAGMLLLTCIWIFKTGALYWK